MAVNCTSTVGFEQGWDIIEKGITKLKNDIEAQGEPRFSTVENMTLYSTVYSVCFQTAANFPQHTHCEQLQDKIRESIEEYLTSTVLPYLKEKHDELFLREFLKRWLNHKIMVQWLSKICSPLDKKVRRLRLPKLEEVGRACFWDVVFSELSRKVTDALISLINQEREGEQIDRALLKNVLSVVAEIGEGEFDCYRNDFVAAMLKDTAAYYSRKASNWVLDDYQMLKNECIEREKDMASRYLGSNCKSKLLEMVQIGLLSAYATQMLENEHSGLLKIPVIDIFKQYVTAQFTALVRSSYVFLREAFELHDKFTAYVNDYFQNHSIFHKALKDAFEDFCNQGVSGSSIAEILAACCDRILKNNGIPYLSDESHEIVEKVVKLLGLVHDKDLFAEFYREKLARRLLFNYSSNDEYERNILTKLKTQFGGQFTSKIERMATDFTLASENRLCFEHCNKRDAELGIVYTVTVLTKSLWPSYKSFDLNLPPEMAKCVQVLNEYQTKTRHRKVTLMYSLGTWHINVKFNHQSIELIVTTYQAAVLLLFNASEKLSCREIMTKLNLSEEDAVRVLYSLSYCKQILLSLPHRRPIYPTHVFEFNSSFRSDCRLIKMPMLPAVEKKVTEVVDKDRRSTIDASIVRIMKSRKVLSCDQLVMECLKQLGRIFEPDVEAIKKQIEDLIGREYLKRDEDNPDLFVYLEDGVDQVHNQEIDRFKCLGIHSTPVNWRMSACKERKE